MKQSMGTPNYEDGNTTVMVSVIKDLVKRVEDYEQASREDRAAFKASIEASIVQLRKDFQRALTPFMLENIDHRQQHKDAALAIFQREEKEDKERKLRQDILDRRFTYLTIGVVVLGCLIVFMIVLVLVRRAGVNNV